MEPSRIPFAPSEYRVDRVRKGVLRYVSQHLTNLPKVKLDEWLWQHGVFYDRIAKVIEKAYIDSESHGGDLMSEREQNIVETAISTYLKVDIEETYPSLGKGIIKLSLQLEEHGDQFLKYLKTKGVSDTWLETQSTESIAERAVEYLSLPNRSRFMTVDHLIDSAYRAAVREYFQDIEHVLRSTIGDKEMIKQEIKERYAALTPEGTPLLGFELNHLIIVSATEEVKHTIRSLLSTTESLPEAMIGLEQIPKEMRTKLNEFGYEYNVQGAKEDSNTAVGVLHTYFAQQIAAMQEEKNKALQISWQQFQSRYPKVWSKLMQKKDKAHVIKSLARFYNKNASTLSIDITSWENDNSFWSALDIHY